MKSGMTAGKFWNWIILFLVIAILLGALVIWSKYEPAEPVEISIPTPPKLQGEIEISGAVRNPGIYAIREGDSLSDLIAVAGGLADNAAWVKLSFEYQAPANNLRPRKSTSIVLRHGCFRRCRKSAQREPRQSWTTARGTVPSKPPSS